MATYEAACKRWSGNYPAGGLPRNRAQPTHSTSKREVAPGPPSCPSGYSRRQLLALLRTRRVCSKAPAPIIHALRSLWALPAVLDDSHALAQGDIRARPLLAGCLIYGFGHSQVINVGDALDDAVAIRIPAVDAIGEGSFRQCRSRLRPVGQGSNSTQLPFLFA
jgi:hypothetical protein